MLAASCARRKAVIIDLLSYKADKLMAEDVNSDRGNSETDMVG